MSFGTVTLRNCGLNQTSKIAYDVSVNTLQDKFGRAFFRVGEMRTKEGKVVPVEVIQKTTLGEVQILQLRPCDQSISREYFNDLIERGMIVIVKDGIPQKYPGRFGKVGGLSGYMLKVSDTTSHTMNFHSTGILTAPKPTETPEYLKTNFAHLFKAEAESKIEASIVHTPKPPSTPRPPVTPPPGSARGAITVASGS